jgi:hypothetical protein
MQTAEEKDLAAQSALHLQAADHLLPQDSPSGYANCKNALINRSSVSQSVSQSTDYFLVVSPLLCGSFSFFCAALQQSLCFQPQERKTKRKYTTMKDCEAACLGLARFLPHLNSSCLLLSIWTLPDCVFQCFCSLIHMTKGILAMDHHLCELPILISI